MTMKVVRDRKKVKERSILRRYGREMVKRLKREGERDRERDGTEKDIEIQIYIYTYISYYCIFHDRRLRPEPA